MVMTPGYRHCRPRHNICSICWSGHCPLSWPAWWCLDDSVSSHYPHAIPDHQSHGNIGMWPVGHGKWIYDFESKRYHVLYQCSCKRMFNITALALTPRNHAALNPCPHSPPYRDQHMMSYLCNVSTRQCSMYPYENKLIDSFWLLVLVLV